MNKQCRFGFTSILLTVIALTSGGTQASADFLTFDQLNWFGLASSTPNSDWGKVTYSFTGSTQPEYFNLNVNGRWVVQNLGIASLYGAGVFQTTSTFFDLGVSNGTRVNNLNYAFSTTTAPITSMPVLNITPATVNSLDFQIGSDAGVDSGTPGAPPAATPSTSTPVKSGKMPQIDKFDNQVQGPNQCVPGAISNSLVFLQSTERIDTSVPNSIREISSIVGTTSTGTPFGWWDTKKSYFDAHPGFGVSTTILQGLNNNIDTLINNINAGQDVEIRLVGHAAVVAGLRQYTDGKIEMDIFDDNQKDSLKDPLKTFVITNNSIYNMQIDRFVIECPAPEPPSILLVAFGSVIMSGYSFLDWKTRASKGRACGCLSM